MWDNRSAILWLRSETSDGKSVVAVRDLQQVRWDSCLRQKYFKQSKNLDSNRSLSGLGGQSLLCERKQDWFKWQADLLQGVLNMFVQNFSQHSYLWSSMTHVYTLIKQVFIDSMVYWLQARFCESLKAFPSSFFAALDPGSRTSWLLSKNLSLSCISSSSYFGVANVC